MRNLMIFLAVAVLAVSLAFFTGARTALPAGGPAQEAGQSERAGEPAAERSDPGEEPATEEEPSERPAPEGPARRGKAGPEGGEHPDKDGLRSAPSQPPSKAASTLFSAAQRRARSLSSAARKRLHKGCQRTPARRASSPRRIRKTCVSSPFTESPAAC